MIEKMLNKMEELRGNICAGIPCNGCDYNKDCYEGEHAENRAIDLCKKIVQEVAKDGGWIPCSERLPEHMQQCLTTARIYYVPDHVDESDNYIGVELNTYSKNFGWLYNPEVIAWQPLPAPYQKGE